MVLCRKAAKYKIWHLQRMINTKSLNLAYIIYPTSVYFCCPTISYINVGRHADKNEMKGFLTILYFLTISISSIGQVPADQAYKMTWKDNNDWIKKTKNASPELQLKWIKQRLIINREQMDSLDSTKTRTPFFIIGGITIKDTIPKGFKDFVLKELTFKNTEILVTSEENLDVGLHYPKSVVLIIISDEKIKLELEKLNENTNAQQKL